jgi:prepilin peptidase CpaA
MLPMLTPVFAVAFAALVLTGGVRDLVSYIIPNWISVAIVALFPLAALAAGLPLPVVGMHAAVGAGALAAGMIMFSLRWIGGGDAKLFAAAALWIGLGGALEFVLWTSLLGGALAMALMSMRSPLVRPLVLDRAGWLDRLAEPGGSAPYGVAIAAGALVAMPNSPLLNGLLGL